MITRRRSLWQKIAASATGLFLFTILLTLQARSQVQFRTPGNDSIKVVQILNAKAYNFKQVDSSKQLTTLVGDVRIKQEKTLISCDSMILDPKDNYIESFGHVHINDGDSTHIYSDYMKYLVDQKKVHFDRNVKLTDGKGVLTTENLDYDLNAKVGTYDHGGKIVNKESVLTSERGVYYEATKDVYFKKNVVLRDPQYDLSADSLLYNTQTQISTFITETFIQFKDTTRRTVRTREGFYDLRNRKANFGKRPIITDGAQKLTGDKVDIDDSLGLSTASGHAIYKDTAEGTVIIADYMRNDTKTHAFLATQNPVMIIRQDKDSIYLAADTFYSGRLIDRQALMAKIARLDSLHKRYVDSLERISADSLRRLASIDSANARDTMDISSPDSTHRMVVKLMSDSLRKTPDSLKKAIDTLHKMPDSLRKTPNSLLKPGDSLRRVPDTLQKRADTLQKIPDSLRKLPDSLQKLSDSLKKIPDSLQKLPDTLQKTPDNLRKGLRHGKPVPGIKRPPGGRPPVMAPNGGKAPLPEFADSSGKTSGMQPARPVEPDKDHEKFTDTTKAPITDSTLRYILAYHHVRIFSDSLQAVADSMYYSTQDSVFRLFYNPIAWGNGNYQITGDTMYVYTKNKKMNRLYVFENGLAINKVGTNFYNQIKGTTINSYFKDGQVDYMRAKGNAESIYYVQDDNRAYTGVNKAHADIIDMIFGPKDDTTGRELRKVVLRNDAEGSMIPFKKVNFDDMRLRGFKWQEARRPKTKEELFENRIKVPDEAPVTF